MLGARRGSKVERVVQAGRTGHRRGEPVRNSGDSWGTTRPAAFAASAASTPSPPALPIIASRRPAGSDRWSRIRAGVDQLGHARRRPTTPDWANSASTATVGAAAAAVCDAPARRPPSDRPPTTASSGLRSLIRRATRANFRALPNDSR